MTPLARALPLIFAALVVPCVAYAQDDPVKLEQARPPFDAGQVELAAGRYLEALRLFQESDGIYRSENRGALYNIALCEDKLGKTAAAYLHYREFLRNLETTPETDERIAPARAAIQAMEVSPGGIRFVGLFELPPGAITLLDGVSLGPLTGQTDYPAQPGQRVVVVKEPDKPERRIVVEVSPDKRVEVDVRPEKRPLRSVGFVLGGVGLGSLLAGTISGALALSKYQQLEQICGNAPCPPERQSEVNSGERLSTASTATLVIGGALVATGITLVFVPSSKSKEVAVAPLVLPGGGGFTLGGRF